MPPDAQHWTTGPAKSGAVGFLAGAGVLGLVWSMTTRAPGPGPSVVQPSTTAVHALTTPQAPPQEPPPVPAPTGVEAGQSAAPPAADPEPEPEPSPPPAAPAEPTTIALRINVNTAPAEELRLLPGIGPVLAERIVEQRVRGGPFRTMADLTNVRGIGEKTAAKLAPHVRFE